MMTRSILTRVSAAAKAVSPAKLVEVSLRRLLRSSDYRRWGNPEELNSAWDSRAEAIARRIPRGSKVIDFGAGRRQLERLLHSSCSYTPSDLVDRGPGTIICDLNHRPLAVPQGYDIAVFAGVFEYLFDLSSVVKALASSVPMCIASYTCVRETLWTSRLYHALRRTRFGWMNSYTERELVALFVSAGYECKHRESWQDQLIWVFRLRTTAMSISRSASPRGHDVEIRQPSTRTAGGRR